MAQLSIEDLPQAPESYRPSCQESSKFETEEDAIREDAFRLKIIDRYKNTSIPSVCSFGQFYLRVLHVHIEHAISPASAVYMREHRDRIGGNLWTMMERSRGHTSVATVLPASWEFAIEDLHKVDPRGLLAQFRMALVRAGAQQANGWLFLGLHGEHEPNENKVRLHAHIVANGDMVDVVNKLREQRNFKSRRDISLRDGDVYQRVRVSRAPLINLPEPLTYTVQSFWPSRPIFEASNGSRKRQRDKHRIKEPWHTEVLLWLAHWRLRDMTLLMGIKVGRAGLYQTQTYIDEGSS